MDCNSEHKQIELNENKEKIESSAHQARKNPHAFSETMKSKPKNWQIFLTKQKHKNENTNTHKIIFMENSLCGILKKEEESQSKQNK